MARGDWVDKGIVPLPRVEQSLSLKLLVATDGLADRYTDTCDTVPLWRGHFSSNLVSNVERRSLAAVTSVHVLWRVPRICIGIVTLSVSMTAPFDATWVAGAGLDSIGRPTFVVTTVVLGRVVGCGADPWCLWRTAPPNNEVFASLCLPTVEPGLVI